MGDTLPPAPSGTGHRRLLINVAIILLSLVLARLAASRLFSVELPDLLSIWGFTTAGAVTLFTSLLPRRTRASILVAIRNVLGSKRATWLAGAALVVAVVACMFVRYDIRWAGDEQLAVQLNGRSRTLESSATRDGYHQATLFSFFGRRFDLEVGGYRLQRRGRLLASEVIDIPPSATASARGSFGAVERTLFAAFYQLFEQQEAERAQRLLSEIESMSPADRARHRRLQAIHSAIVAIFVDAAPEVARVRADDVTRQYPQDPWSPLLHAGAQYAARDYEGCVRLLSDEHVDRARRSSMPETYVTSRFFRGVCLLKRAASATSSEKSQMLRSAEREFSQAEAQARHIAEVGFRDLALPSAIIFQAISQFYRGEFDTAVSNFSRAFSMGRADLRARAFNGAGYVRFVQGNMSEASSYLNDALMVQPNFPYARSNYGFVLMSERDRLNDARQYFLANVQDPLLQRTSRRDVILGKLSLAHLLEVEEAPLAQIIGRYADLSREIGGNTWFGIVPDELRYAYLARELVQRIYLGGQYYAVEVFALTFLCRAKARIRPLAAQSNRDAVALSAQLDVQIRSLERSVHPAWLQQPGDGWFAALSTCHE